MFWLNIADGDLAREYSEVPLVRGPRSESSVVVWSVLRSAVSEFRIRIRVRDREWRYGSIDVVVDVGIRDAEVYP